MAELILCDVSAGLCTLTLNRPDKLNAMNGAAFGELAAHLDMIEASGDRIECIVLRGAGRSFCAGHDLDGMSDGSGGGDLKRLETLTIGRLAEIDIPVIAAVHGHCLTGGLELALAADIIVAAHSARFADTHGRYDLVPIWGLSQRLPRRVGRAKALEMMLASRTYGGREAEVMGLANLCVEDNQFDSAVQAFADDIMANATRANRAFKRLLRETDGLTLRAGIAYELHHTAGRGPQMAERIAGRKKR
jgi:enoyl-CoA hydratase